MNKDPIDHAASVKNGSGAEAERGEAFVHETRCRVRYADVDQMGVAYHANYLRWFEVGRCEMFRHLGLPYRAIEEKGVLMPVSEVFCKFVSGARYDDLITIETRLDPSVRGGMKFNYRIFSENGGALVARGYTKHAFVDERGRVVRPPAFLRQVISGLKPSKEATP